MIEERPSVRSLSLGLLLFVAGCSSGDPVVTGTVTQDGNPVKGAVITFIPVGSTPDLGGHAVTGDDGKYTIKSVRGDATIPPGEYKVTISRFLNPDGTLPDPDIPPIEAKAAAETLPRTYTDRDATILKATVSQSARVHDFELPAAKKR